jgi:shikimate kinase
MIFLIGPGGAGKTTAGGLLAARLQRPFIDLDQRFAARHGDISRFVDYYGYGVYARENVEIYALLSPDERRAAVIALSSGFMTYDDEIHPSYVSARREVEECANTFVLLPSLDEETCVAETVRRQLLRPFARSAAREAAVIRVRFASYMALAPRKISTMQPPETVVSEIVSALRPPSYCFRRPSAT